MPLTVTNPGLICQTDYRHHLYNGMKNSPLYESVHYEAISLPRDYWLDYITTILLFDEKHKTMRKDGSEVSKTTRVASEIFGVSYFAIYFTRPLFFRNHFQVRQKRFQFEGIYFLP